MRSWIRIGVATLCGGCGALLASNVPALQVMLPNVKRALVRGECCAGHAPPDLPQNAPTRTTSAMVPIKKIAGLTVGPKVWKHG